MLAETDRFPDHWLFRHRWGKGKKDSSNRLPTGEKIVFLTVGGRTSAVVPSVQKKTGPVAKDVDESEADEQPVVKEEDNKGKSVKEEGKKGRGSKANGQDTRAAKEPKGKASGANGSRKRKAEPNAAGTPKKAKAAPSPKEARATAAEPAAAASGGRRRSQRLGGA